METMVNPAILQVRDLVVNFHTPQGIVRAVNGVSFDIHRNECLGLVGESGSGKSTIALALLRMIRPPGRIDGGSVVLDGTDLLRLSLEEMRKMRLAGIALVAQGAMNSLNPVTRIRAQLKDALKDHDVNLSSRELNDRINELLEGVGLRREVANMFPHELSGGMKQRVCIAIAVSLRPRLIIADEPTSALDVVVQRQVIDTLLTVSENLNASILLIGHDMGLMSQVADRVGIMYAGKFVEVSQAADLFGGPLHPYSQLLINSLPSLESKGALKGIPGLPPSLLDLPAGCAFRSRCPRAMDVCAAVEPQLRDVQPDRLVSCHLY
jgi:peptide/nickel transport system ATP-binding protein